MVFSNLQALTAFDIQERSKLFRQLYWSLQLNKFLEQTSSGQSNQKIRGSKFEDSTEKDRETKLIDKRII